jgi:hypothetical protein
MVRGGGRKRNLFYRLIAKRVLGQLKLQAAHLPIMETENKKGRIQCALHCQCRLRGTMFPN